jgi:Ser/Thr protein kinase RdoA (MazF antagonist)
MSPLGPDDVSAVLARYGAVPDVRSFAPLGNRGGFSGAALWRGRSTACLGTNLGLRAWPAGTTRERLAFVHRLMAAARLPFVPRVWPATSGETAISHAGRLWELTNWLPGRADFHESPTPARLTATVVALARLHEAWTPAAPPLAPCPAVLRRLAALRDWQELVHSGWRPDFADDEVRPWAERAWRLLPAALAALPGRLTAWAERPVSVQPCLCDVWHDHVLFSGDAVTGIIDYGAVKVDHAAADLARLLGSLLGDDRARRAWALGRYAEARPLEPFAAELVDLLDASGTALGAANWLRWLYHERRHYGDRAAVARRLAGLVARLETETPGG